MKNRLVFLLFSVLCFLACKSKKQEQIKENEYYVCSMDPQVMEKQSGLCPICKMPLTKVTMDINQLHHIQINNEQAKLANVKVQSVTISSIGKGITLNGVFVINQNKTEQISARIKGRIEHLYYKIVGTRVSKGDKIYDLYSRELLQAQEEFLLAIEKGKLLNTGEQNFIQAAKNKLVLWGLNEQQVLELEKTSQPRITNTIYSKVSGVITDIPLKEGEYVNEGSEIYKVADLSSLWVEAQLYANEFSYLREGEQVDVIPESYPDEHNAGKVMFAIPELQQQSKINLVRIEISNPQLRYKPGMQVYIDLKGEEKNAIVLPVDAVIQNSHSSVVWVQTNTNTFEPRNVTIGLQNSENVEILSGLEDGDSVVVSGAYLLNSEFIFKRGMNPMDNANHQNMKM